MTARTYYAPHGGLPPQSELHTGRAVFTEAYAVIPKGVMSDIVASSLPFWDRTRAWVLARPLSGFAETFAQYIMEVAPGGGSDRPEPEADAERETFSRLNAAYVEKFGFPFIIAVKDNTKAGILAAFRARIDNDRDTEFATACTQVERIAELRLATLLPA